MVGRNSVVLVAASTTSRRGSPIWRLSLGDRSPAMLFSPLKIPGPLVIELEKLEDDRGFFARWFCRDLFMERGLCTHYPQWSISFNHHRDTVRGLHFQAAPYEEIKLVPLHARGDIRR